MTDTTVDPTSAGSTDTHAVESRFEETPEKSTDTGKTFDAAYVKELREENAKHRTEKNAERESREKLEKQLADVQKKVEEFERAKLSETERLTLEHKEANTKVSELQETLRESFLEAAVAKHARQLEDVDATVQLLDKKSVEYDDSGRPTNIDSVLEATLEKFSFLKASGSKKAVDTGTTNPGRQKGGGTLTKAAIQNMPHEERVQRMDEIQAWVNNGYK